MDVPTLLFRRNAISRTCSGCTVCCTLLAVLPLGKPKNTACEHCTGTGCAIFGQIARPSMCGQYQCAWLWNKNWPEELRPDKCHVLFEPIGDAGFVAAVEPGHPEAWKTGAAGQAIQKIVTHHHRYVYIIGANDERLMLTPETQSAEDAMAHLSTALEKLWQHPAIQQTLPS